MNRSVLIALCLASLRCTPLPSIPDPKDSVLESDTETTDTEDTDTEDTDADSPANASYTLSNPIVCDDPSLREDLGPLFSPDLGDDWSNQLFDPSHDSLFLGSGAATIDVNGDGLLDLFLPGPDTVQLFLQSRGVHGDLSYHSAPLPEVEADRAVSATVADVDGDGDMDIFVARHRRPNLLLINDGSGVFSENAQQAGVAGGDEERGVATSWADMDLDGDLDLFVGNYGNFYADPRPPADPSHYYENAGDGTFIDRTGRPRLVLLRGRLVRLQPRPIPRSLPGERPRRHLRKSPPVQRPRRGVHRA